MKKFFLPFLGMLFLCATLMAQTPSAFKYQAVARDASGSVMADQPMSVRMTVLKGAQVEYMEVHSVTTNDLGLFTVEVGRGSPESGNFFDIEWSAEPHFLRIEMDPEGGSNFRFLGISELLSVPYAMHAQTVEHNDDADADPDNEIQDLKVVGNMLRVTNNPNPTQIDLSQFNTDQQQISYDADNFILTLENGGSVNLQTLMDDDDADATNELQTLSQTGTVVTLSHGGGSISVEDADASPSNELQTLSQNGNVVTLSNGGGSITVADGDDDASNEIQDLNMNSNFLYITNNPQPTVIDMNHFLDNTDDQNISWDAQTGNLSLEDGGVVNLSALKDDADADSTNELQTISRVGNDIVLSQNGGTVNIEDGDSDATNEVQTVSQNGLTVTLSHGGGSFTIADDDNSPVNEIQDLMVIGDSLVITNNPSATAINIGALDNQTLNFDSSTYELTIANGNTVDLTDLKDDDDSNPLNEIQDLYLSNDSLVISNNPWATVINLAPYMDNTDAQTLSLAGDSLTITGGNSVDLTSYLDNTDAQTLSLAGDSLTISGGNSVDLTSYLDNTDAQTLSLAGDSLTISGGNSVDLSSYLDADDLGNHTATQNIVMSGNYLSNDGDSEGIKVLNNGNVNSSGDFFVGESAGVNRDLWLSAKAVDWDNSSYYVDPNAASVLSSLTVNAGVTVSGGGITVTGNSLVTGTLDVTSDFGFDGAFTVSGNMINADTTAGAQLVQLVDASAANVTLSLPAAASVQGRMYIIKRMDGSVNTVTVDPAGAETVDGAVSFSLPAQYDYVKIVCDGTQWLVIGQ